MLTQEMAWVRLWHRHPARAVEVMRSYREGYGIGDSISRHFGARQYLATALEGYSEERRAAGNGFA